MKFLTGNTIQYAQDSDEHTGIVTGVEFIVEKLNDELYRLTADGYGELDTGSGSYGEGPLYVWGSSLSVDQKSVFDEHAKDSKPSPIPYSPS